MLRESKIMLANIDRYFQRKYRWRYHVLVVDNHFYDCYSFFLQAYRYPDKLHYSYDLVEFDHNKAKYGQVLKDLRDHYQFSIEFRDTHHLVHPGTDIVFDASHGHAFNTTYHSKTEQ